MPIVKTGEDLPVGYAYLNEIWKAIPGYENLYEVSNKGRVRTIARRFKNNPFVMKPFVDDFGYLRITLRDEGGNNKKFKIHRLVAFAFILNPLLKAEVNHKNGNKQDNRPENLEWNTRSENANHAYMTGLQGKGDKHGRSIIKEEQVISMREDYKNGMTNAEIVEKYKTPYHATHKVLKNKNWKHLLNN